MVDRCARVTGGVGRKGGMRGCVREKEPAGSFTLTEITVPRSKTITRPRPPGRAVTCLTRTSAGPPHAAAAVTQDLGLIINV